jgi:hypothetical protein
MDPTQLAKEQKALQAHLKLIEHAGEVRRLFEEAGMALPPSVATLLGEGSSNSQAGVREPRMVVTPPESPQRPLEAEKDWVWVPASDLSVTTLVLGILRQHQRPLRPPELFAEIQRYNPDANFGSMLNIGLRLNGVLIERSEQGWKVTNQEQAPVLHEGHAWGPAGVFLKQEVAAHRRVLICHILRAAGPKGMQTMDITRQLQNSTYCRAPVSKDLVKMDMQALEGEHKVRKVGYSRRWTIIDDG